MRELAAWAACALAMPVAIALTTISAVKNSAPPTSRAIWKKPSLGSSDAKSGCTSAASQVCSTNSAPSSNNVNNVALPVLRFLGKSADAVETKEAQGRDRCRGSDETGVDVSVLIERRQREAAAAAVQDKYEPDRQRDEDRQRDQ